MNYPLTEKEYPPANLHYPLKLFTVVFIRTDGSSCCEWCMYPQPETVTITFSYSEPWKQIDGMRY